MRKIVLIVFAMLLFIACHKKQNKIPEDMKNNTTKTTCIDLEDYYSLISTPQKANWLKKYGELVCKEILEEAIRNEHKVDTSKISNLHEVGYSIKWNDLKKLVEPNYYNVYLSFTFNSSNDVTALNLVPDYSEKVPCYSIPFIMFLGEEENIKDKWSVEFKIGDLDGQTVLFVIVKDDKNKEIAYYNQSDKPL